MWLVAAIGLAVFPTVAICGALCEEAKNSGSSKSMAFALLFLLFEIVLFLLVADSFIRCRYVFKKDYLCVQSVIFLRIKISYKNIRSFCESKSAFLAPACSLDRIKKIYRDNASGKESFTLVSPRNKQALMEKLGAIIEANGACERIV